MGHLAPVSPTCWIQYKNIVFSHGMPPVRIELTTPGLQDQCSAAELKRLVSNYYVKYEVFKCKN